MSHPTICAICRTEGNSTLVYPANLDEASFSTDVFSARRLPDRRHYQWVRCNSCGLLRSDPVFEIDLNKLYMESSFDYSSEVDGLKRTYIQITEKAINPKRPTGSILEIGGGSGFFLEAALDAGFEKVAGVEPSVQAVAASRSDIKPTMIIDMMKPGIIPNNSYDVVAMFHVLDHLPDSLATVFNCIAALKPGGTFVVAVHDEKSWSAWLMKEKSPIVDVEHTYLYSELTARKLFERAGLINIKSGAYWNFYSLAYLVHLIPISRALKTKVLDSRVGPLLAKIKIAALLGNIWISGQKAL